VIAELTLSHFRSHKRTALTFSGRPVAIWGPNGAGKTNILEAISLLSPGRGLRRAAPEDLMRRPEAVGWKVRATVGRHDIDTFAEGPVGRTVLIDGKPATQSALGRICRMLWLVPAMDRLWIEGADGRRRFLDRMTLSFDPDHAERTLAYDKAMRERNRLLKDGVRDPAWYDALERQMAASGAAIQTARAAALLQVTAAQRAATGAFPSARLSVLSPEGAGAVGVDALTDALATGRSRDQAAGRTLTGPHRDDLNAVWAEKDMPAAQCSTGEQKAILISLILSNARALAALTGQPPVILLDEVAAHLDEGRRTALYDEVVALGAQAFMTGTGAELFAGLEGRAEGLSVADRDGLSEAVPAAIA
jgi:DNA replication and repair protein RecF